MDLLHCRGGRIAIAKRRGKAGRLYDNKVGTLGSFMDGGAGASFCGFRSVRRWIAVGKRKK